MHSDAPYLPVFSNQSDNLNLSAPFYPHPAEHTSNCVGSTWPDIFLQLASFRQVSPTSESMSSGPDTCTTHSHTITNVQPSYYTRDKSRCLMAVTPGKWSLHQHLQRVPGRPSGAANTPSFESSLTSHRVLALALGTFHKCIMSSPCER